MNSLNPHDFNELWGLFPPELRHSGPWADICRFLSIVIPPSRRAQAHETYSIAAVAFGVSPSTGTTDYTVLVHDLRR